MHPINYFLRPHILKYPQIITSFIFSFLLCWCTLKVQMAWFAVRFSYTSNEVGFFFFLIYIYFQITISKIHKKKSEKHFRNYACYILEVNNFKITLPDNSGNDFAEVIEYIISLITLFPFISQSNTTELWKLFLRTRPINTTKSRINIASWFFVHDWICANR